MSIKKEATHELLTKLIQSLEEKSPINIEFITHQISTIVTTRIKSIEQYYQKSTLYTWLLKKGMYPIVLFTMVTASISLGVKKAYSHHTKLVLDLLGVVYPTYTCWHILKDDTTHSPEQVKSWLTYWIIFGSCQVLDHWMNTDLFPFSRKKYNLYKLFVLYWAQNPHSNGAQFLYRHVIQKPAVNKEVVKREELFCQQEEEEEHTMPIVGYSYLDGYHPPNLLVSTQNSSDDDDSIRDNGNTIHITTIPATITSEKGEYPLLHTTNVSEPAW